MKQTLISGIKPTGEMHIGNYFGAIKQFIDLQDKYSTYIFIADLHALTTIKDPKKLEDNILHIANAYLASGLDPKKVKIFKQSDLPQVTELAWIFNCLVPVSYLNRSHAFKDAENKNKEVNVGVFTYPVLMAADILIQNADVVPVGKDQKQHIEYTRDIAQKFNNTFCPENPFFKIPKELIIEETETVPGIDGQKMSKSYNNTIPLFAEDDEIEKLVMKITTDSGSSIPENVYAIHKLFRNEQDLKKIYEENKGQYKKLKEILTKDIQDFIAPKRELFKKLSQNKSKTIKLLKKNAKIMNKKIEKDMEEIRKMVGYKIK